MNLQKVVRLSMFTALAIVLNIFESYVPIINLNIPGVKVGLTNIVILSVIYLYGFKEALYVSIIRIFVVGILRTGLFSTAFLFSLSGSIISLFAMYMVKKIKMFSIVGVSIVGSIFHSIGQIIMAYFLLKNINVMYYLPFIIIISIVTGIIIGIISKEVINHLKDNIKE